MLELPGAPGRQEILIEKLGFKCHEFISASRIKNFKSEEGFCRGEKPFKIISREDFYQISPAAGRNDARVHISALGDGTLECPLAVSSNNGAIIFMGKLFYTDEKYNRYWMVDPFKLTDIMLNSERRYIIPDPCVQSGNRAAFIHIDGDGFNYKTEYNDERYSGEIITDEIIDYYKFPTTASLIVSEIHSQDYGNKKLEKKAAELMRAPYVEPASHSWYHPFKWGKVKSGGVMEKYIEDTEETDQIQEEKIFNPANKVRETCLEKEILRSCEYIGELGGRPCRVMCWTGMCNPTPEALALCENNGIYNINGGDTRFDGGFKLYSNLRPHYNPGGGYIKFNARYVNEFIMTDHWCPPYDNFKKVIEGFQNTGAPHLLTPINIYYHFYSGTKKESLEALKEVYNYTAASSPSFMKASDWIDRVRGFINCKITQKEIPTSPESKHKNRYYDNPEGIKYLQAFKFENAGKLDNFRWDYDGYPMLSPDSGVIGYKKINGSLYINTGMRDSGEIYIIDRPPDGFYLKSFTGNVISADYDKTTDRIYNVEAYSAGPLKAVFAGAGYPFYKIYFTNSKNETSEYAGEIDDSKNELIFGAAYEYGRIKISVHYSTHFDNIKSRLTGVSARIFYFFKNNPIIIIILIIYVYFIIQNRYQRSKKDYR